MGYSDDGEPQGTAGMPVLDVIRKKGITDVVIVVTRYFGGVLLGASGLVRAYGKAASMAVSEAGLLNMKLCREINALVDYSAYGKIQKALEEYKCIIKPPEFGLDVTVKVILPEPEVERLVKDIKNITSGLCEITLGDNLSKI
jgi:uncharacterized YigZ family protein